MSSRQPPTISEAEPLADSWGMDDDIGAPAVEHRGASLAPIESHGLDLEGDGRWDLDADLAAELHGETGAIVAEDCGLTILVAGQSEAEIWCRNSPLAADHVAAGAFESAIQLHSLLLTVGNADDRSRGGATTCGSLPRIHLGVEHRTCSARNTKRHLASRNQEDARVGSIFYDSGATAKAHVGQLAYGDDCKLQAQESVNGTAVARVRQLGRQQHLRATYPAGR